MKTVISKFIGLIINIISLFSGRLAGKMALALFTTPFKGGVKEAQTDFLDTSFLEDLDYNEFSIRTYRWLGKNKTVLLAHGWESNTYRWKELIIQLKALDYNVIGLDAPAHGRSGSKRFNAILYSEFINVTVKKFKVDIIIGHSVGGMASIFCLNKYKNLKISKLILLGAPSNYTNVVHRYFNMMSFNKITEKHVNQLIIERLGNPTSYYNASNFTKELEVNGLIIHDEKDNIIPYSDAKDYESSYKNAQFITTKNSDHSLNNEQVFNHIFTFIKS